jgi:folylpolyglutamate synthase
MKLYSSKESLDSSLPADSINLSTDSAILTALDMQKNFAKKWRELDPSSSTSIKVLPSVEDAVEYIRSLDVKDQQGGSKVHTFITGSVHLVGRALGILEGIEAL